MTVSTANIAATLAGAWSNQAVTPPHDPRREIVIGSVILGAVVFGFGGWAALTRLDAAVVTPGVIRMGGTRVTVQSPQAGVVSAVLVNNGALVAAGQPLVELANGDALAQERALASRVFALQAQIARIGAELRGDRTIPPPAAFAGLSGNDRDLALQALSLEQAQTDTQHELEIAERAVLANRAGQVRRQVEGYRVRLQAMQRQRAFNADELASYESLLQRGLATKSRVLGLRSSAASIDGDAGMAEADIARLQVQVGESRLQMTQIRSDRLHQNAEQMRTAQADLQVALSQWQAARLQLARAVVRAPEAGVVSASLMPGNGTVVAAGAGLFEIVPSSGAALVEAHVDLADANELQVGQPAQVRLSVARGVMLKPLNGKIQRVSADSVEDQRTGRSYYVADIAISRDELRRVGVKGNVAGGFRSGTPVEVVVPTKARSAWTFLLGPLVQRMSGAFAQR